jgi:signal transduction histidine kinase
MSRFEARFETRFTLLVLAAGLGPLAAAVALLWLGEHSPTTRWSGSIVLASLWLGAALAVRRRLVYSLRTVANLLEALRQEDFSIRAKVLPRSGALGDVLGEINDLAEILKEQRLGALEASALLRKVMREIDVAVFAFDPEERLRLVNRAGERLLARPARQLTGRPAEELGLAELLEGPASETLERAFPGGMGRWGVRRSRFRERGRLHRLLVVSDLSQALREEERKAWQRLIRVIGHELNNSLAPIKSMAATLRSLLSRRPSPADLEEDLSRGLKVIEERAGSLSRFLASYSRLAKLPPPRRETIDLPAMARCVAVLEERIAVEVVGGPDVAVSADREQLEQLLINLVKNAADASLETGGGVRVGWTERGSWLTLWVEDDGPGPPESGNLFVPFFTTKPGGSGIGLALSRQIAETHGGQLALEQPPGGGCRAVVRLPSDAEVQTGLDSGGPTMRPDGGPLVR